MFCGISWIHGAFFFLCQLMTVTTMTGKRRRVGPLSRVLHQHIQRFLRTGHLPERETLLQIWPLSSETVRSHWDLRRRRFVQWASKLKLNQQGELVHKPSGKIVPAREDVRALVEEIHIQSCILAQIEGQLHKRTTRCFTITLRKFKERYAFGRRQFGVTRKTLWRYLTSGGSGGMHSDTSSAEEEKLASSDESQEKEEDYSQELGKVSPGQALPMDPVPSSTYSKELLKTYNKSPATQPETCSRDTAQSASDTLFVISDNIKLNNEELSMLRTYLESKNGERCKIVLSSPEAEGTKNRNGQNDSGTSPVSEFLQSAKGMTSSVAIDHPTIVNLISAKAINGNFHSGGLDLSSKVRSSQQPIKDSPAEPNDNCVGPLSDLGSDGTFKPLDYSYTSIVQASEASENDCDGSLSSHYNTLLQRLKVMGQNIKRAYCLGTKTPFEMVKSDIMAAQETVKHCQAALLKREDAC